MNERGVRLRLVVGATIFAAVAIGAALITGRLLISAELHNAAESLARSDLIPFLSDLETHPDERPDPPGQGVQVGIQAPGGEWIIDSLPDEVRSRVDGLGADVLDVGDDDGDSAWVVVGETAQTSDGTVTLWAARDVTAANRSLLVIDLFFVIGGAALIALFAAAATVFVRSALRPVEAARRRERQFVSDAAHELRTPLAGLQAQLGLARRELDHPDEADRELQRAEQSAERLGVLASNLLELARLDEGTPTAGSDLGQLREAFLTAVDDIRSTPAAAGVSIEQTSPASVPASRCALDAISFGRIVRNLLANAVTATGPDGSVTAELTVSASRLELVVQDDGPGIAPELLPHALDRFARGDGAGSGLGLALVDALARSAGGGVTLINTRPGLRVVVEVPLH